MHTGRYVLWTSWATYLWPVRNQITFLSCLYSTRTICIKETLCLVSSISLHNTSCVVSKDFTIYTVRSNQRQDCQIDPENCISSKTSCLLRRRKRYVCIALFFIPELLQVARHPRNLKLQNTNGVYPWLQVCTFRHSSWARWDWWNMHIYTGSSTYIEHPFRGKLWEKPLSKSVQIFGFRGIDNHNSRHVTLLT